MFFVSYPTALIYSNSPYIVVPMMRSIQLVGVYFQSTDKQGLLDPSRIDTVRFDSLTQSVSMCHNATRWISSLGSTELKWVHNRVCLEFDSQVSKLVRTHYYLL